MHAREAAFDARFERVCSHVERGWLVPVEGELVATRPTKCGATDAAPTTFAFEVHGNGMLDEGIRDGDRLLIQSREPWPPAATVLVEVGGRFTVKRLRRENDGQIRPEPTDPALLPLVLRTDQVRICGVVIGLVRRKGFATAAAARQGFESVDLPDASRLQRSLGEDRVARDLTYRILKANVGEWTRLTSASRTTKGVAAARIRSLGRSLNALVSTYTTIGNERLRRALLEEAGRISREMRDVAADAGWPTDRIRPLPSTFAPAANHCRSR